MIAGGVFASVSGRRSPSAGRLSAQSPAQKRATKILRVGGPFLIVFGLFRLFTDQLVSPAWQRHLTSDGFASAEFPATPQSKEQTDTANGVSAQRTSLICDVPFKDISLFLSFSPLPVGEPAVPDSERLAALKSYFTQQGFTIVRESPAQFGASPGFVLDLERDGGKVRMWTRIAYVAGKVYRVVVSSTGSHHDDAIISHYLDSFRIERTGA